MSKAIHLARSGWFWTFVFVSSLVFSAIELRAQTPQPTPTPTPDLKTKVKVVEVTKTGTALSVKPDKVQIKKYQDIVVWVTNGVSMQITFKPGNPAPGNPFTDLVCKGRFCAALTPSAAQGTFTYKVTVDGVVLDPNVEVIP
ncbi:MAG TPA: hypothetical protein VK416_02825 [Thermoanaerobaculia bacterium]|nr:hypothetical protein [Thermoanaerobaculia bacterium]